MVKTKMLKPFSFLGFAQNVIVRQPLSFNQLTNVSVNAAATQITFTPFNGSYYLVFEGTNLSVAGNELTGGTVDGMQLKEMATGDIATVVSGLAMPALEFQALVEQAQTERVDQGQTYDWAADYLESLVFGTQDQKVIGSTSDDFLHGGPGDDTVLGRAGDDVIFATPGNDTVDGQGGTNMLNLSGADLLDGLKLNLSRGVLKLADGSTQTVKHVSNVEDGSGGSLMIGDARANVITGNDGDDRIRGLGGDDYLYGGAGEDNLKGGDGNDFASGGADRDRIRGGIGDDDLFGDGDTDFIWGELGNDFISGGDGSDLLYGNDGNDRIYGGKGRDLVHGDDGNDKIRGDSNTDVLLGDAGDDVIVGGTGRDVIEGGTGNDRIIGGSGVDKISGDEGRDVLTGGFQDDIFEFYGLHPPAGVAPHPLQGLDIITDLEPGDVIRIFDALVTDVSRAGGVNAHVSYLNGSITIRGIASDLLTIEPGPNADNLHVVDIFLS